MKLNGIGTYTIAIGLVWGLAVGGFSETNQGKSVDNNQRSTATHASDTKRSSARPASQQMTMSPSATVSWDELVRLSETLAHQTEPAKIAVPFMTEPEPERLNDVDMQSLSKIIPRSTEEPGAAAIPPVGVNFQALPDNGSAIPPDTHGAIGKNHAMTMLNTQVRIQDKLGNIISTVSDNAFWAPAGGSGVFDPRLIYDQGTDRWLATCDANRRSAAASVLFAISATDDPTGSWTFYRIDADPTNVNWNDFPDIGFNNTWIAITNNMYGVSDDTYAGNAMWVIDKSTALAGGALTWTYFPPGSDVFGTYRGGTLRACHTFGSEPKLYVIDNGGWSVGTHVIRISEITGTASAPVWTATPGSSPYVGTGWFLVANDFEWGQIDASQLGTSLRIDTNDPRLRASAVFRNGHIWICHSAGLPIGAVDRTAVFWYELDPLAMPNPIVQSGVLDGGTEVHYFFPSIAANVNGDAFMGFSRSDPTIYAEAVYTGRRAADPLGTMDAIRVLKAGEDSYVKDFGSPRIRWGDYSATVIDPSNDLCAWTIQEYAALDVGPSASNDRWGTWWGQICVDFDDDIDDDGIADNVDNCPYIANPDQADADLDGDGDLCDECTDTDGDFFGDPGFPTNTCATDDCPDVPNPYTQGDDADGDGVGDACDLCPGYDDGLDSDGDGIPDGCDGCCVGRVGDADNSGNDEPSIGDVAEIVDHLFIDKPPLVCVAEADINQSGGIDPSQEEPGSDITIGDLADLVDYLFITTPAFGVLPDCL